MKDCLRTNSINSLPKVFNYLPKGFHLKCICKPNSLILDMRFKPKQIDTAKRMTMCSRGTIKG